MPPFRFEQLLAGQAYFFCGKPVKINSHYFGENEGSVVSLSPLIIAGNNIVSSII